METPEPHPGPENGPLPEPASEEPKRWPIHQRLIGSAVRAGIALLGGLPLAFWILHKEFYRWEWEWLWGILIGGLCGFILFAFERRGSKWWKVALRLLATGAVMMVLAPMAFVWLENIGDPSAAYSDLTRLLRLSRVFQFILFIAIVGVITPVFGLWIYVRNRTASLLPQVLAASITLLLPTLLIFANRPSRNVGWTFWLLTAPPLIALATWFGDRLARRFDPDAPEPTGSDVRPIFASAGVLLWVAISLSLGLSMRRSPPFNSGESYIVRSLEAIASAQSRYHNRRSSYAGSLPDLIRETNYSGDKIGVGSGYVYRLIRSNRNPDEAWSATADPIDPGRSHYVVDQKGTVYRSDEAIRLDPETCELPWGLEPATRW